MPILAEIYRYPVKSTRGQSLRGGELTPAGLPFDRAWMVADEAGRMVTGRTDPRLVLVNACTDADSLVLSAPGMADLLVPLVQFSLSAPASVWKDDFPAFCGAKEADVWLSNYLGKPVRLLFAGYDSARRVRNRPDVPLAFADGFPFLLIGQGSLDELNQRIGRELPMQRFRPNLVVAGAAPFAEDGWKKVRIGDVVFSIVKPCERCVFTTVDPLTGEKSPDQEPLRTLAKFRKTPEGVLFGQNVIAENVGRIEVGMPVEILELA